MVSISNQTLTAIAHAVRLPLAFFFGVSAIVRSINNVSNAEQDWLLGTDASILLLRLPSAEEPHQDPAPIGFRTTLENILGGSDCFSFSTFSESFKTRV